MVDGFKYPDANFSPGAGVLPDYPNISRLVHAVPGVDRPDPSSQRLISRVTANMAAVPYSLVRRAFGIAPYVRPDIRQREGDHTDLKFSSKSDKVMSTRKGKKFKVPRGKSRFGAVRPKRRQTQAEKRLGRVYAKHAAKKSLNTQARRAQRRGRLPGAFSTAMVPANRQVTRSLAYSMNISTRDFGNIVRVPLKSMWDDEIIAIYPTIGSPGNFITIGTSPINGCDCMYPMALWSAFYQTGLLFKYNMYSQFKVVRWSSRFRSILNTGTSSGDITTICVPDITELYNKGLTFIADSTINTTRGSAFYNQGYYLVCDWQGIYPTANIFGSGQNIVSAIKQWSAASPTQFTPNRDFTMPTNYMKGWKRNTPPASGISPVTNYAWDFSQIQETESRLCCPGVLAMFGTMSDPYTSTSTNQVRKIGDLWLDAVIEFKGLGTSEHFQDPQGAAFLQSAGRIKFKREMDYLMKNYTVDYKSGDIVQRDGKHVTRPVDGKGAAIGDDDLSQLTQGMREVKVREVRSESEDSPPSGDQLDSWERLKFNKFGKSASAQTTAPRSSSSK